MQARKAAIVARDRLGAVARSISSFTARQAEDAGRRAVNASDTLGNLDRTFKVQVDGKTYLTVGRPPVRYVKESDETAAKPKESTGRTTPGSREEGYAMDMVQENAMFGTELTSVRLNDPRWPATDGWVKMSQTVHDIEIHYVYNRNTFESADYKFKDRMEP